MSYQVIIFPSAQRDIDQAYRWRNALCQKLRLGI